MASKNSSALTFIIVATLVAGAAPACGGGNSGGNSTSSPPAGACRTGTSSTGSTSNACTQCAQQHCNAEMSQKSGSGWASQYLGGDGACKDFNACLCTCLTGDVADPRTCTTSTCASKLDATCQQAITAAKNCLSTYCPSECGA